MTERSAAPKNNLQNGVFKGFKSGGEANSYLEQVSGSSSLVGSLPSAQIDTDPSSAAPVVPGDTATWAATSLRHDRYSNHRAAGHCIHRDPQTRLQRLDSGDDLQPERLERPDLVHIGHVEDQVLDAHLAMIAAHFDYVTGAHALRTEVDGAQGRTLYLLVVSIYILAVTFQDL